MLSYWAFYPWLNLTINQKHNKLFNGEISIAEVILMAKKQQPNNSASGTNVQQVKKQNQKAAQGQSQYGTEFASETDAQQVKKQNQQSQQKKK